VCSMKAKGLKYMQDVVYNHFGAPPPENGNYVWLGGSTDVADYQSNGHYNGVVTSFEPFVNFSFYHKRAETYCDATANDPINSQASLNRTHVQVCWLSGLADLNQDVPFVREQLFNWTRSLFSDLGVDALRLDTCPYIDYQFYVDLRSEALGDHYVFGEVLSNMANYSLDIDGDNIVEISINRSAKGYSYILNSMEFMQTFVGSGYPPSQSSTGLGAVEDYAFFFAMMNAFVNTANGTVLPNNNPLGTAGESFADMFPLPVGSLVSLRSIIEKSMDVFGTGPYGYGALDRFIENQDQPRFIYRACQALTLGALAGVNWKDFPCNMSAVNESAAPVLLYMNALTITIMMPGVPSLIYGGEQAMVGSASSNGNYTNSYRGTFRMPQWITGYSTEFNKAPLYSFIARLAALRKGIVKDMGMDDIDKMSFVDLTPTIANYVLAFERGQALVVISNLANRLGELDMQTQVTFNTGYKKGQKVCDVLCYRRPSAQYSYDLNSYQIQFPVEPATSCDCATVEDGGMMTVELGNEPRIYFPEGKAPATLTE